MFLGETLKVHKAGKGNVGSLSVRKTHIVVPCNPTSPSGVSLWPRNWLVELDTSESGGGEKGDTGHIKRRVGHDCVCKSSFTGTFMEKGLHLLRAEVHCHTTV